MAQYRVPVVVEVILERVTNISMGSELDNVMEFDHRQPDEQGRDNRSRSNGRLDTAERAERRNVRDAERAGRSGAGVQRQPQAHESRDAERAQHAQRRRPHAPLPFPFHTIISLSPSTDVLRKRS